jgi:hypothetical protein
MSRYLLLGSNRGLLKQLAARERNKHAWKLYKNWAKLVNMLSPDIPYSDVLFISHRLDSIFDRKVALRDTM